MFWFIGGVMVFVLNVVVYWWSVEFLTKLLLFIDGVFHKFYLFLIVLQTNQNRVKFHKKYPISHYKGK